LCRTLRTSPRADEVRAWISIAVEGDRTREVARLLLGEPARGLIVRGRNAQSRPCRLEATPIKEIVDWAQRYRHFWDQSFDRLGEYLGELQRRERKRGRRKR